MSSYNKLKENGLKPNHPTFTIEGDDFITHINSKDFGVADS